MQTSQHALRPVPGYSLSPEEICPYQPAKSFFCSASVMTVAIDSRRKATYCNTEDFDRCPFFLAKILRGQ
jgi:hypothetical protein